LFGLIVFTNMVVAVSLFSWQGVVGWASQQDTFNSENYEDVFFQGSFTDSLIPHVFEFPQRPSVFQVATVSSLANLGLVPSQGWVLSYAENSTVVGPSNHWFGITPLLGQADGCLSYPEEGVLMSNRATQERIGDTCFDGSALELPEQVKLIVNSLLHVIWLVLAWSSIVFLVRKPKSAINIILLPGFVLVLLYGVLGGGIDRYGSPAQALIIVHSMAVHATLIGRRYGFRKVT
jgi:hypothetical protein